MTKQEVLDSLQFDMEVRNRSKSTISDYCTRVRVFQDYYDKPADQMGETEIRKFLHYLLVEKNMNPSTVNTYNASLRYVYTVTLNITLNCKKLPRAKVNRRLPDLPSKEELLKIFNCAPSLKYRAIFMTIYGSGLRVSEAANLKISDIDSKNMRIFVRSGKGDKDRFALLPEKTLFILRDYYRQYRPIDYLFIARSRNKHKLTSRAIRDALNTAVTGSGVKKHVTVHTLRHCFATHLLNEGKNIFEIKNLLGHVRIDTTTWYLQLSDTDTLKLESPLDTMRSI